jgi:hypothetical protein
LFKTAGTVKDTIASGYFSTHDTISDWTPFSAWINYTTYTNPDTMNIFAASTAQYIMTPGTVLFVDDITLDYTTGINEQNPETGIEIYQDKETKRLLVFIDFSGEQFTAISLYNLIGQQIRRISQGSVQRQKMEISYADLQQGIYILEIIHANQKVTKKFMLNF